MSSGSRATASSASSVSIPGPPATAVHASDDESINFFRICRVVLDDVPSVLRSIFKDEFHRKYGQPWADNRASGNMLMKHDHWQAKLSLPQKKLLSDGNTQQWDGTLLFHALLHSSLCLFADKVQGTQCVLKVQKQTVSASVPGFDFQSLLQKGCRVIFDLGNDQFRTDIVGVQKSSFFTKHPFKPPHGLIPPQQTSITVDMYICRREWFCINDLAQLRNASFAHCGAAHASAKQLHDVVQRTERIYIDLKLQGRVITGMKAIENEPIATKLVVKQIEHYREQWMKEHEHYKVISREVSELKEDVIHLKTEVREISDVFIPQTQKEMETMKEELERGTEVREEIKLQVMESKKALGDVASAKDALSLDLTEMRHEHKQTTSAIEEQAKQLETHTRELQTHEKRLESAENQMEILHAKETNVACRVSYAMQEITQLSQSQKKTSELVKQTQGDIAMISEVERQLSDEVVRTKEIVQQLSVTEEETVQQVVHLEKQVSTMQTQLQESQRTGRLHILNPSDFTADVKYYTKQHHSETRKWLLDDIEQWHIHSTTDKVKMCLITGNPGMGKSVLASVLCTMASGKEVLGACFFFQHHKARRNNPKVLVQTLAYQFCFKIPHYKETIEKHLIEENIAEMSASELFTDLILEPLHHLQGVTEKRLIVIDGLDECDFEARDELLKLILREFVKLPEWIGVIMTTRPDQKILKRLSKIKPVFELNPEDPRNINDIKLYLGDVLRGRMQNEELREGLELMVKKSEGMFLYFHYATESILQYNTLTLKDLDSLLPDGIDDYYEQNFRRLYTKLGKEKYQLLLQAITAARSEFPRAFISPLLKVDNVESTQIVDTISVLLPVQNGWINMFHKSIQDWLIDEDLADDLVVDSTAGHSHVAALCYEQFMVIKSNAPGRREVMGNPITKYVIDHLVYHLCKAQEQSLVIKLCSIVTDLQYMYYKLLLSQSSAKDLIDDIAAAKKVVSVKSKLYQGLEVCASFVYRYAQTLGSMPQLLFQCALNEPQDVASQLGLEPYQNNPAQHFPGLAFYLEVINKPQNKASALTEYHCENMITSLTKTSDGNLLICSDSEGKIYIWDKHTGELLQEQTQEDRNFLFPINKCSVSPDGNLILFGKLKEALSIDGTLVPLFISGTSEEVNTCVFSPCGQFILAWSYYSEGLFNLFSEIGTHFQVRFTVQIWNRNTATSKTLELTGRKEVRPTCAGFSHDSAHIVCGHRDGWIILWETSTSRPKAMLSTDGAIIRQGPFKRAEFPRNDPINDIAYSRNGHYLAACHNKGIIIWDAASFNLLQKLQFNPVMLQVYSNAKCVSCSFSSDSKNLAAGLSNGYIHVWSDNPNSEEPYVLQLSTRPYGSSDAVVECFFEDDQTIVCAMHSLICIYSYESLLKNPAIEAIALHPKYATNCAILQDGITALTCGHGSICSWDIMRAFQIASTQSTVSGHLLRTSADGKLALTFGEGCHIQIWETNTLTKVSSVYGKSSSGPGYRRDDPDSSSPQDMCHCAVSIHDVVVGGTGEGTLYIWYGKNYESVKVVKEHESLITYLEFSHQGDCFVSADMEGFITMWQLVNCIDDQLDLKKVTMQRHNDSVEQVIFSPPKVQRIISCGSDNMIHMYNSVNGDIINRMEGHASQVLKVAYSASGEFLVSGDGKCQLILWNGFTGQLIQRFTSSSGRIVLDLCFSAEDKFICARDVDMEFIRVYSVSSGTCASQIDFPSPISAFAASSLKEEPQSHMVCTLKDGSVKFLKLCKDL